MRRKTAFGAGILAALAMAPAAQGATITYSANDFSDGEESFDFPGDVAYGAADGEVNTPTLTATGTALTISDPSATLALDEDSDEGCTVSEDAHTVTCTDPSGFGSIGASLRDRDDTAVNEIAVPADDNDGDFPVDVTIRGGSGNDTLTGSDSARDDLRGGAGDDVLNGRGGNDFLSDFDFSEFDVDSEGGNDVVSGGEGDDFIQGGTGDDTYNGDAGSDQIFEFEGSDKLNGGDGQDVFLRSAFRDSGATPPQSSATIDGGLGEDSVSYSLTVFENDTDVTETSTGATIRLDSGAATTGNGVPGLQSDSIAGVEDAAGSEARDTIAGSALANDLNGFNGDDQITGGGGLDVIGGGQGADAIDARDGGGDRVRCSEDAPGGDAGDTAQVDDVDDVARCPTAGSGTTVTPVPTPQPQVVQVPVQVPVETPADTTAPNLAGTRFPSSLKARTARKRIKGVVKSDDAKPNQVVATITARPKGRVRIAKAGDVIVAQKKRTFTGSTTLKLKPSSKVRRSIRKGTKLRLLLEVRDAAGNRSVKTYRIRIK